MTILFLVVTAVMWVLLFVAVTRRRGTLSEHAPIDSGGGQAWIAIGGLAIPLVVLSLIFVLGLRLLSRFPIHGAHGAMDMNHGAMEQGRGQVAGYSRDRSPMVVGSALSRGRSGSAVHHRQ